VQSVRKFFKLALGHNCLRVALYPIHIDHEGGVVTAHTHTCRSLTVTEPRVHQAHQQAAVRPMEGLNTWGSQYLWPLHTRGACCHPQAPRVR